MCKRIFSSVVAAALITCSTFAYAFKVDSHVWVGQQVINDIQDGNITIDLAGKKYQLPVDANIADAIRNYPEFYRMGTIGPDAWPDILTGQMVVHPGNTPGWQTDDWLKWVLKQANSVSSRPQDVAFAYGYLAHAAADVFSHTYVNQYSGDIFDLKVTTLDIGLGCHDL
jgi:hypothetical protein